MKKIIIVAVAVLAAASLYARDAKPQFGPEGGMNMPPQGGGPDQQNRPEGRKHVDLSQAEAKAAFTKFVSEKLKGYTVVDVASIIMPFGSMHQALVKDASGNRFYLNIDPEGKVGEMMLIASE